MTLLEGTCPAGKRKGADVENGRAYEETDAESDEFIKWTLNTGLPATNEGTVAGIDNAREWVTSVEE